MASLRGIKRDIDYLVSAVMSDCYTCAILKKESQDEVLGLIHEAIDARNSFIDRANHPAEKHNKHLVTKHYSALRSDLLVKVDEMFGRLSAICQK